MSSFMGVTGVSWDGLGTTLLTIKTGCSLYYLSCTTAIIDFFFKFSFITSDSSREAITQLQKRPPENN